MIAPEAGLSVSRQCALLGVARSSFYYRPPPEFAEELELLKRVDRIFTSHPVYGSRRLRVALLREGISVGRRRVRKCPCRWRAARGRKALARAYYLAYIKEGKVEGQQPALVNLTMPPDPFNLPLESSDISARSGRIAQLRRFNLFREPLLAASAI